MKKYYLSIASAVCLLAVVGCSASEFTGNLSTGLNIGIGQVVNGVVVVPPTASPLPGTYSSTQAVTLTAAGSDSIRYTLDGTNPSCSSGTAYSTPIEIVSSKTVTAVACFGQTHPSSIVNLSYTIQQPSAGGSGVAGLQTTRQGRVLGVTTGSAHPNGTLILDGQTIFLIKDGKRAGFRNPEEYFSHGYNFGQTVETNDADRALPEGPIIKALEGTLAIDGADGRTVYMVGLNGSKRGFTSEPAFTRLGYSFGGLPTINLSDYLKGDDITEQSETHPEGALVLDGQTVWWLRGGQRMGFESEQVFNTYGFTFGRAVNAIGGDLSLPEGARVKFRDGALIRHQNTLYVISDGLRMRFGSDEALLNRGYKMSNLITADVSGYEEGSSLE